MFLDEGARTIGVWLPLALADLKMLMTKNVQMWAANPEKVKLPRRSETLASWCLPMLSKSLKAAEEEAAALEFFNSVERLAANKAEAEKKRHDCA